MHENCVIQKRVAYFDCTAVLDDSCAALAHVGLPSVSLLASLVRPHSRHEKVGGVGWHRSSVDLILRRSAYRQNRCQIGVWEDRQPFVGLMLYEL